MFSETRYALNGELRVAYRTSREGPRDIVFVPNWMTCCDILPELPSLRGWVEAMTSLGRLIFFDQPGTGASDPVTPGAQPTLEQWADSITAVLDELGSHEAVLLASNGGSATAALSQGGARVSLNTQSIRTCRGTRRFGRHGRATRTPGGQPGDRCPRGTSRDRSRRAGGASPPH